MMLEKKTTEFLDVLSSKEPVPGGGGASATVGAFAGALGMMVANLTIGKKKYAGVEEEIKESLEHLRGLQKELIRLTDADAEAFEPLAKAYGLPKETPEQKAHKEAVMETALYEASLVPLEIMETIAEVMEELDRKVRAHYHLGDAPETEDKNTEKKENPDGDLKLTAGKTK